VSSEYPSFLSHHAKRARLVAVITFIIVALVIFLLVKVTKKWGIE
jgi:large-conductance mechanosensitive channel